MHRFPSAAPLLTCRPPFHFISLIFFWCHHFYFKLIKSIDPVFLILSLSLASTFVLARTTYGTYCGRLHTKIKKKYTQIIRIHQITSKEIAFQREIMYVMYIAKNLIFLSVVPIVQKQPKNTSKNTSKRHECNGSYFCASSNCLRI